jgi:putative redox protein
MDTASQQSVTAPTEGDPSAGWVVARATRARYRTEVTAGRHMFVADEPAQVNGGDEGATPYDYLLGAIGSCTVMTLRMYADRKGWPLEEAIVRLRTARSHAADCGDCETKSVGVSRIERQLELRGELTDEQRQRLLYIADRCPVKQTLQRGIEVVASERARPVTSG